MDEELGISRHFHFSYRARPDIHTRPLRLNQTRGAICDCVYDGEVQRVRG